MNIEQRTYILRSPDTGFAGGLASRLSVRETETDITLTVPPEFFISAHPLALDGLTAASRAAAAQPERAKAILSAVYEKWGPGDALEKALEPKVRGLALSSDSLSHAVDFAMDTGGRKFGLKAIVGAFVKRQRQEEVKHTLARVTERVDKADPYFAMADAVVRPVAIDEDEALSAFVYADGRDQLTPDTLPREQAVMIVAVLQQMVIEQTQSSSVGWFIDRITQRIGKLIRKEGEARIFTRPRATVSIHKQSVRDSGGSSVDITTSSDSEILFGVMGLYRAALAYVVTEGRSSYPQLSHWQHLTIGRASRGAEAVPLVKGPGFAGELKNVVAQHEADARLASGLIRQTLGPVVAHIIEERSQFPDDTAFPLNPRSILLRDASGRALSLDRAVEHVLANRRARVSAGRLSDLEYAQHQTAVAVGEKIGASLALCAGLFGKVSVEQMVEMFPLLPSGLAEFRDEHALALSQAAVQKGAILGHVERVTSGKVDIDLDAGSETYLKGLVQALGGEFTISFTQIGEMRQAKIPGDELYRILQDAKAPFDLRKRVASFLLRKFVGYPPDFSKTPDILGKISMERRGELQEFRGRLPNEPFTDIVSDPSFSPAEAKKMVRVRIKSIHPDVQRDNLVAGEATLLFNDLMEFLDELERERGEGLAATLTDI